MSEDKSPKTEEKKKTPPKKQGKVYSDADIERIAKENRQAERTRMARVHEEELSNALEKQETSLNKEFKEKLAKHTQLVRQNAYDTILEKMRQAFLMKQENLSFPAITINEYNEIVEEFGSQEMKDAPLL